MEQISAVPQGYYKNTHKVVEKLNNKGIERLSEDTNIPIEDLKQFKENQELDGWYMPALYSNLFGVKTPLEVHQFFETELEGYVEFLNSGV